MSINTNSDQNLLITPGMEGKYVSKDCFRGKKIAVLTSGGDSQGMNSAVRAVTRMGIYCGCTVYFIKEGYQGMVDGGDNIVEATWASVSEIMQLGGTVIGSARCNDFRSREGRLKAAKNLVDHEITNLVIIGGDGSLTGANRFRIEWNSLLTELQNTQQISNCSFNRCQRLNIVGIVGSIDNDFCGTDMTIGTDSALQRIVESIDALYTTADSHKRCFVVEVMGRHCGYLALMTAIATEATFAFVPESPPDHGWENSLCEKLKSNNQHGQRVSIIIVAEGAHDRQCQPITANDVMKLIVDRTQMETRVAVLGHIQRGGRTSAFDRILAIRMGVEAVLALIDAEKDANSEACVISIDGNETVRVPLMKCVEMTNKVCESMKNKDFKSAVSLRGKNFVNYHDVFLKIVNSSRPNKLNKTKKRVAVLNVGAPSSGANAAVRSFTQQMIAKGYEVIGIHEGFKGLLRGSFEDLTWDKVCGWSRLGGSMLGIRRKKVLGDELRLVGEKISELNLSGMLIIGGFEAYKNVLEMYKHRQQFPQLNIPMLVLPATISNNIPGTEFCIGTDTALNEITHIVDKIKLSAFGSKRRVFVVETHGRFCGYLPTMSGLAGGADAAYIFEEEFGIDNIRRDVRHIKAKISDNVQGGLILISQGANKNYSSKFVCQILQEEGKGIFDARLNVPGHLIQGGDPSPFDRTLGAKLGVDASEWCHKMIKKTSSFLEFGKRVCYSTDNDPKTASLLGIIGQEYVFSPVCELEKISDFEHELPVDQWWLKLRSVMKIMSMHQTVTTSENAMFGVTK